jgi:hypothetical protein
VEHTFQNYQHVFQFKFRDSWSWIVDLLTDATLSAKIMWYPVQKYLHDGFKIVRLYDELNSGDLWWEIQV